MATHLLVPYAAALAAFGFWRRGEAGDRRKAAVAAVFGIAGFAPDLDGLVDGLSAWHDSLYWLQHRGVSHTLVGAPVFALAALGLLVLGARVWPRRMSLFAWRPVLLPAAVLGSYTHLLLDSVTYGGIPLWWPFAYGRVSFPIYHWLVFWMFPLSLAPLVLHAVGRLPRRGVVMAGALVVVLLLIVGGARLAARPWDEEGALIYSMRSHDAWVVARELPNGTWILVTARGADREDPAWFEPREPPEAADAIARARDTDAYRGFLMGSFGPRVTRAAPLEGGGWNVTILDAVQRYEALRDPEWAPHEPFHEWGYVAFRVHPDGRAEATHRGW